MSMETEGPKADLIARRLSAALQPRLLEVRDDSAAHHGHAGAPDGGESHFSVAISARALDRMSRLERHRAIHAAIGADLMAQIHALAIDARSGPPE